MPRLYRWLDYRAVGCLLAAVIAAGAALWEGARALARWLWGE